MGFSKMTAPLRITAERTVRVPLDLPRFGDGVPTLICRYAGDGNDGFINAQFKAARLLASSAADLAAKNRAEFELEAPIYAEHVVIGWEHIYEDDASAKDGVRLVEFSVAKCIELLLSLAADAPDQLRRIMGTTRVAASFRDQADDLGKG